MTKRISNLFSNKKLRSLSRRSLKYLENKVDFIQRSEFKKFVVGLKDTDKLDVNAVRVVLASLGK